MTGIEIPLLVIGAIFFVASFFIAEKLGPKELNKIGELSNREIRKVMERELQKVTADIQSRVEEKADQALAASESSLDDACKAKIKSIGEYSDTVMEAIHKSHNEVMFLYSMLNDKHVELTQFASKLQELAGTMTKHEQEMAKYLSKKNALEEARAAKAAREAREAKPVPSARDVKPVREERPDGMEQPKQEAKETKSMEETKEKKTKQAEEKLVEKYPDASSLSEREEDFWPDEDIADSNHNAAILALHKEGKSAMEIARELVLGLGEVQLVIGLYEGNRKQ